MPAPERLELIRKNLATLKASIETAEKELSDAKKAGIDLPTVESEVRLQRSQYEKLKAVYG